MDKVAKNVSNKSFLFKDKVNTCIPSRCNCISFLRPPKFHQSLKDVLLTYGMFSVDGHNGFK